MNIAHMSERQLYARFNSLNVELAQLNEQRREMIAKDLPRYRPDAYDALVREILMELKPVELRIHQIEEIRASDMRRRAEVLKASEAAQARQRKIERWAMWGCFFIVAAISVAMFITATN